MRNPFHHNERMNQLLLPRDYSTIQELIIVFTACIFLTGNVLAFVENCSHRISLACEQAHSCANSEKSLARAARIYISLSFSLPFFYLFIFFVCGGC